MKTIPLSGQAYQRREAMMKFVRAHPVWTSFVVFFYMLGVLHAVHDLAHFALGWTFKPGGDYETSSIIALTLVLVLPRVIVDISPEQRDAEKKILDEADEIVRRARDEAK